MTIGTITWGQSSGTTTENTSAFTAHWTGTGTITGSGDSEKIIVSPGEYMESEVVETVIRKIVLRQNKYGAGDDVTISYRTGTTSENCQAASWAVYSVPFVSEGFVQVRLDAPFDPIEIAPASNWTQTAVALVSNDIVTDDDDSDAILPWYSPGNYGASFDYIMGVVFAWWLAIPAHGGDPALPYGWMHMKYDEYWSGLGGDQLQMAISSWILYFAYSGDADAKTDIIGMCDHILANGLSDSGDDWPNIPYPYQNDTWDVLDGDYIQGAGVTMPDKAGSFGLELLHAYKLAEDTDYLNAAIAIANTLSSHVVTGDLTNSPLPFRVETGDGTIIDAYTSNWCPTLEMFEILIALNQGNVSTYASAKTTIVSWLKTYCIPNTKFGPFFEDISGYSDTEINAGTLAMYIMTHRAEWGVSWDDDARACIDWSITNLGDDTWSAYGVRVMQEQTVYANPGQSHSSRDASLELVYADITRDLTRVTNAVRELSWATYMVASTGINTYPGAEVWLTDGYGDYVRHYIRSMAAVPDLAPSDEDHILKSSSVVQSVTYGTGQIDYETFDAASQELLRVTTFTPSGVTAGGSALTHRSSVSDLDSLDGWTYGAGGDIATILRVKHSSSGVVVVT